MRDSLGDALATLENIEIVDYVRHVYVTAVGYEIVFSMGDAWFGLTVVMERGYDV